MKTQKSATVRQLVLRTVANGLIGGALALGGWILVGLLYGFAIGLTDNHLALLVADKTFQGAIEGLFWVPLGALAGAVLTLLRHFWVYATNRKRLARVYWAAGVVALVLSSVIFLVSHRENAAIAMRYLEFCSSIRDDQYENAYSLMSPTYRRTHSVREFREDKELQFNVFQEMHITGCGLNAQSSIDTAGTRAIIYPGKQHFLAWYAGPIYHLELVEGEWELGEPIRIFDEHDPRTQILMNHAGVNAARDQFVYQNHCTKTRRTYSVREGKTKKLDLLLLAAPAHLRAFVETLFGVPHSGETIPGTIGSYDVEITNNNDETATFRVINITDWASGSFELFPAVTRMDTAPNCLCDEGCGGRLVQEFVWIESIPPCACY